jgi:predicted DsbA family dithiol-disulfide isomerase
VNPLRVEIASDVVCPWCYIGKRRLEKALALLKDEIKPRLRWLPFQLNPGMPKEGMPRAEYRKAKFARPARSMRASSPRAGARASSSLSSASSARPIQSPLTS